MIDIYKLYAALAFMIAATMFAAAHAYAENGLYICALHEDQADWDDEFAAGSVVVPAGTVFAYAGHVMAGNLQDPRDLAHSKNMEPGQLGWSGISKQEEARRDRLTLQDLDDGQTSAVVTTGAVTLTKAKPCALAPAKVVLSKAWGWRTNAPIKGDSTLYYQAYGVIRRGDLDTFRNDRTPVDRLGGLGELNASIHGMLTRVMDLDRVQSTMPPDEMPVDGPGNTDCWSADWIEKLPPDDVLRRNAERPDITCRAITEKLLLSLRYATKADVIKAMNVNGREIEDGERHILHFLSNYSKGQRTGSGDVNFIFDADGRVSVITASVDRANLEGDTIEFIWNAHHVGCSDFPGTSMQRCKQQ